MTYGWNWGLKVDEWLVKTPKFFPNNDSEDLSDMLGDKNMVFNETIPDMYKHKKYIYIYIYM